MRVYSRRVVEFVNAGLSLVNGKARADHTRRFASMQLCQFDGKLLRTGGPKENGRIRWDRMRL